MTNDEKIIQFPGQAAQSAAASDTDKLAASETSTAGPTATPDGSTVDAPGVMNEQREKSMQIALSGMSFITVGIQPTETGADFFTAVDGVPTDIRDALPVLEGVIERAFQRRFED